MKELDSDDKALYSEKLKMTSTRDIVNFIEFSELKKNQQELAQEAFFEIPKQFLEYMRSIGITPEDLDDTKIQTSKSKLKKRLEDRKEHNKMYKNIIAQILESKKEEFIQKLIPLGHKRE